MKSAGRTDTLWHDEALQLRAGGMSIKNIGLRLGVTIDRVSRVVDPTYAARKARTLRLNRIQNGRCKRVQRREITTSERSIVKELSDGTRISLPRVAWLERPMPGASA